MDPIVATYAITLTIRAPKGTEGLEAPTIDEIVDTIERAFVENVSGNGVLVSANATAQRTDD